MSYKTLVIGSGFNALATAFLLKKKNHNIKVVFERNIKGVLGSVQVEDETFDLGYQFFDGLDNETETFIREMFSNKDLYNFKYGASTFSNNYFYSDHAITFWPSYGKVFIIKAFLFYFKNFVRNIFFKKKKIKYKNLKEFYSELPPNIKKTILKGCIKNFQISADRLSVDAHHMSTITSFRQTLFKDEISNFLKNNSKYFNEVLASRRKYNPQLDNISLYPKGKNMEYITDKLIEKLKNNGVDFEKNNFDEINIKCNNDKTINVNGEEFNKVVIASNLNNTKKILKIKSYHDFEHYISQVFIYFAVKKVDFKFQYTQVNDVNLYCSRISNCSLYSKLTKKNNHILIVEIPLKNNEKLWENDEELIKISWNEIIKCGIVSANETYQTVKILKIPKTFAVPKMNFFDNLNLIKLDIKEKYKNKIDLMGQGVFTRHLFVKELLKKY